MSFLIKAVFSRPSVFKLSVRRWHNLEKIGCREVVGHGPNGKNEYYDNPAFPFPAIRFRETTEEIACLKEKEKGDWKNLTIEEKKCLYRVSFCQTFAEFQHPTGQWKYIIGIGLIMVSFTFWAMLFCHVFVYDPLPDSYCPENKAAQLRRMLDLRVGPATGLASEWDYVRQDWKKNCK